MGFQIDPVTGKLVRTPSIMPEGTQVTPPDVPLSLQNDIFSEGFPTADDASLTVDTGPKLVEPFQNVSASVTPASNNVTPLSMTNIQGEDPLASKPDTLPNPKSRTGNTSSFASLMKTMGELENPIPLDPTQNLTKNQRMILAFAALKDAGMALQGEEGTSFASTLEGFRDRQDMERKRQAALAQRKMTERLLGGGEDGAAGGGVGGLTDEMLINAAAAGLIEPAAVKIELERRKEKQNDLLDLAGKYGTIDLIDALEAHPNLGQILGAEGTIRGVIDKIAPAFQEDYSELMRRVEQLQGGVFKEAFRSLRGGGQITEKEGEKASAALARLSTAQGEKAFRQALAEYKFYIRQGIARLNGEDIPLDNFYIPEETVSPEAEAGAGDDVISDEDLEKIFD